MLSSSTTREVSFPIEIYHGRATDVHDELAVIISEGQGDSLVGLRIIRIVRIGPVFGEFGSASLSPFSSRAMRQHRRLRQSQKTAESRRRAISMHNGHETTTFDAHGIADRSSIVHSKTPSLLIYKPQCTETVTAMRLAESITFEGATDSWFEEIPARYGHANCFDSAAHSLMLASEYGRGLWDVTKVLKVMSEALSTLRLSLRVRKPCMDAILG